MDLSREYPLSIVYHACQVPRSGSFAFPSPYVPFSVPFYVPCVPFCLPFNVPCVPFYVPCVPSCLPFNVLFSIPFNVPFCLLHFMTESGVLEAVGDGVMGQDSRAPVKWQKTGIPAPEDLASEKVFWRDCRCCPPSFHPLVHCCGFGSQP